LQRRTSAPPKDFKLPAKPYRRLGSVTAVSVDGADPVAGFSIVFVVPEESGTDVLSLYGSACCAVSPYIPVPLSAVLSLGAVSFLEQLRISPKLRMVSIVFISFDVYIFKITGNRTLIL